MKITRRSAAALLPAAAALGQPRSQRWTSEWDRDLILASASRAQASFDPAENMLRSRVGPEYRYHTTLRDMAVHPTRDSIEFALLCMEAGRTGQANAILDRTLALQDTDPSSKWYGIWSYYLEEPLPKMAPADWNWADFNGSYLLLTVFRHGPKLGEERRKRVLEAIRHAAASIRRRNVSMTYTNIAVQGTFVTLAAAEVLGDSDLLAYAKERLRRFCATVDVTGSFAEYNSPTYAHVTIANLTRMRMTVKDQESLALVDKLHYRAWLHLASHWHASSRQLGGPMSRAYSTDIAQPLWLQKALDNRIVWKDRSEFKETARVGEGEVGLLAHNVPEPLVERFLEWGPPRQHREIFLPGTDKVRPVQGTTWLTPLYTLGSVNRGDFWVQRRPLLAYWGRPARWAQLRFVKDDYDFASALFYSVQERGHVLGAVNFRTPGGDKHVSLDPLPSEFEASRLRLRLDLPAGLPVRIDGRRASVELGRGFHLTLTIREAQFGEHAGTLTQLQSGGIGFDLLPPGLHKLRWADLPRAFVVFTLVMAGTAEIQEQWDAEKVEWTTPAGVLRIAAGRAPATAGTQDAAFSDILNGTPVPMVRLSDERLV